MCFLILNLVAQLILLNFEYAILHSHAIFLLDAYAYVHRVSLLVDVVHLWLVGFQWIFYLLIINFNSKTS